jgi:hypothetical protein
MDDTGTAYLRNAIETLRKYKALAEGAMSQVADGDLTSALDPESNSIAIVVKHLWGNMRSRWTDFLTTDGEKPDRARDTEFELDDSTDRRKVLGWWEEGWGMTFAALQPLAAADLTRTVRIRGETMLVLEAINRQIAHYSYHVGQIVLLSKHLAGERWRSISIPRARPAPGDAMGKGTR